MQYSILLYNTEKSDTNGSIIAPEHCSVLFPPQTIDVDMVRIIKNMRYNESADYMDFANKHGYSNNAKIADVLWLCSSIMANIKIRSLMVSWFTNVSEPHAKGSALFKEACTKAEELAYFTPDFQLIKLHSDFNVGAFYQTFTSRITGKDEDDLSPPLEVDLDDSMKIDKVANRLLRQDFTHRALSYLSMEISEKVRFGVGVYNFTRKRKEPTMVKLDRVTNQPIEASRAYKYGHIPEDPDEVDLERSIILSEILTADKTVKYQDVGGEQVKFTPLEVYEMKQVMQPKIKLLGFKPLTAFKQDMHLKNPYFIYPSEKVIKGSTSIFRALWESCIRNEKFALCIFTMRLKSSPRVVALTPQAEDAASKTFDGFRLEFLPYASDIRELSQLYCSKESAGEEKEELLAAVTGMISKCAISYDPSMIKYPVNNKIFNAIECSVFNEEKVEVEDCSMPNVARQDERIGKFVEQIKELVGGFEEAPVAAKRKAPLEGGNRPKKVAVDANMNTETILDKCKAGDVKQVTVPMLKEYLKGKSVSGISKMTKDDLIAKIIELN